LSVKIYRTMKTEGLDAGAAVVRALADYQSPVPRDVLQAQISLAVNEATDWEFVPVAFRDRRRG
jgi:hypothetical protein